MGPAHVTHVTCTPTSRVVTVSSDPFRASGNLGLILCCTGQPRVSPPLMCEREGLRQAQPAWRVPVVPRTGCGGGLLCKGKSEVTEMENMEEVDGAEMV